MPIDENAVEDVPTECVGPERVRVGRALRHREQMQFGRLARPEQRRDDRQDDQRNEADRRGDPDRSP